MKVKTVEYFYNRECGCCTEWGVELYIDGVEHETIFSSVEDALLYVLTNNLGVEVECVYAKDDD